MRTISDRCTRRSTSVTTQGAFGKTSDHSAKGLFVVTKVGLSSWVYRYRTGMEDTGASVVGWVSCTIPGVR